MTRCAILDDYQRCATKLADWAPLGLDIADYDTHFDSAEALVRAIEPCEIVLAMRERTPFPREVLERLPRLKLLLTTGPRNPSIDLRAAEALGITVCGTTPL